MKTIAEFLILLWVLTFITHEAGYFAPTQEIVATIAFGLSLLLYSITFSNRSSSAPSHSRSLTGTR